MITVGNYTILLIKKEQPARLKKQQNRKQTIEQIMNRNARTINIILMIILMIMFIALCYHLVPTTHGFYHW